MHVWRRMHPPGVGEEVGVRRGEWAAFDGPNLIAARRCSGAPIALAKARGVTAAFGGESAAAARWSAHSIRSGLL
jgi:hypothetical protein